MHGFRMDASGHDPVVITRVDPGSPAAQAGLAVGDVVVAIGGVPIDSLGKAEEIVFHALRDQQPLLITRQQGPSVHILPVPVPDRSYPVHPAQLYSAIDAALLCWLLWAFYSFRRHDGQVVALMLILHPITRFLLEVIRTDEPAVFGTGLSISQNISIGMFVIGVGLWWYVSRRPLVALPTPRQKSSASLAGQ